jgi:hypothetical protein
MTKSIVRAILDLPRAQFVGFDYASVETGELATYSVNLAASTEALYKRDIAILEKWEAKRNLLAPVFQEAVAAILASRRKSLTVGIGEREDYTNRDTFEVIANGLKVHKVTNALYVDGLVNSKTILVEGTPRKTVNSAPLTIAKRTIESRLALPSRKYRRFKLEGLVGARIAGESLILY